MKWIILVCGIFAVAAADLVEDSGEDLSEDSNEDSSEDLSPHSRPYMSYKEAQETIDYILNNTKKIRFYVSRLDESVNILKTKIWTGLRNEIVTAFMEQKQKVLNRFTASKTDFAKCEHIFQAKVDGLVADAEKTLLDGIKPLHEKILEREIYIIPNLDRYEKYLMDEESLRAQIEACAGKNSNYWSCQLKDSLKRDLDEDKIYTVQWWLDYVDDLRKAVVPIMDSILDKYDDKLIKKQVYAVVTECLLTFEAI